MPSPSKPPASCTRRLEFDAAHRVQGHEGKCRNLHGHRYVVEATFSATTLDSLGRVVDFGVIKTILGQWLDDNWDHTTILFNEDASLGKAISAQTGQTIYYMPTNPTAENMADYLLHEICPKLFASYPIRCTRLRLYETPNCYAESAA